LSRATDEDSRIGSAHRTDAIPARAIGIANQHPRLRIDRRGIADAIRILDTHADRFAGGCPAGDLSIVFLTDETLAQLHGAFLDDPTITDVITFEGNPSLGHAGEICVSVDAARRQTGAQRSPAAFSHEVMLYVVHGWLHLAGYDDLQPAKKRIMRRAEARAMRLLSKPKERTPRFTLR
jgi:probable rRNA maturation factor